MLYCNYTQNPNGQYNQQKEQQKEQEQEQEQIAYQVHEYQKEALFRLFAIHESSIPETR